MFTSSIYKEECGGVTLNNSHKHIELSETAKGELAEETLSEKMLSAYLLITYLAVFN